MLNNDIRINKLFYKSPEAILSKLAKPKNQALLVEYFKSLADHPAWVQKNVEASAQVFQLLSISDLQDSSARVSKSYRLLRRLGVFEKLNAHPWHMITLENNPDSLDQFSIPLDRRILFLASRLYQNHIYSEAARGKWSDHVRNVIYLDRHYSAKTLDLVIEFLKKKPNENFARALEDNTILFEVISLACCWQIDSLTKYLIKHVHIDNYQAAQLLPSEFLTAWIDFYSPAHDAQIVQLKSQQEFNQLLSRNPKTVRGVQWDSRCRPSNDKLRKISETFPGLQHLELSSVVSKVQLNDDGLQFLRNFKILESLTIDLVTTISPNGLKSVLDHLPFLKKLELKNLSTDFTPEVIELLQAMILQQPQQ